jgi:hypothetical protein
MDWSVYLEAAGPTDAPPLDEDAVELFTTCLDAYSPAVTGAASPDHARVWAVQLTIEDAEEATQAAEWALRAARDAATKAGLPLWPVVKLEATEWERFDASLDEPNTPDLVGVAELAELCGVTRQRASALARSNGFPEPLAELASGPVWDLRMVERFVRQWPRKTGRPAKAAQPDKPARGTVVGFPTTRAAASRAFAAPTRRAANGFKMQAAKANQAAKGAKAAAKAASNTKGSTGRNKPVGNRGTRRDSAPR